MRERLHNCDKVLVSNIQRFSLHDGPGIRTTVFLKGCSLHCPWCSNPENISGKQEDFEKDEHIEICGTYMTCEELYERLMRDKIYYEGGGVTFSGGEPLLQIRKMEPLLKTLKDEGVHLCAETALFVSEECVDIAMKYFDLFYVDIKILNKDRCAHYLGADLELYVNNLKRLCNRNISFIMRMPIISGYTYDKTNINKVIDLLVECDIDYIELLCEHHMGITKYDALHKKRPELKGVTQRDMEECKRMFEEAGISVELFQV